MKRRGKITSRFRRLSHRTKATLETESPENTSVLGGASGGEAASEKIRQQSERLQILSDCLARLLPQRKTEKIVADIFPQVAAHVGADAFFNYIAVSETRKLDLLAASGVSANLVCSLCDACSGGSLHCQAAKTRTVVASTDIQHSLDPKLNNVRAIGVQSTICIPLLIGQRLLGVLSFASRSKTRFTPDEIEFLQLIAGHVAIAMDRAYSEELLRDRKQRLQIALETAKMGMWELDVDRGIHPPLTNADLRKVVNTGSLTPEVEQMMGLRDGGFHSCVDWESRIHPDDRERTIEALRAAIGNERPYDIEHRFVWPDGSIHWVHCRGTLVQREEHPQRFMGVSVDITERKNLEQSLRDSENRYRAIFETVVDAIIIIDERGTITSANLAAERLFGYRVSEMIGHNVNILMPSPYHEHHDQYLENYSRTGVKKIIGIGRDVVALRKDGSTFPIRLGVSEMRIGDERMYTGQVHDITERKLAEEAILKAKTEAELANHAKDQFIAMLSHELRTPLTPVLMTISARETDAALTAELREELAMVRRNLELETRLIDDLLDVNRIARGMVALRLQPMDLHQTIRNVLPICREDIEAKRLTLRLELNATQHNVDGDGGRLQQVFWNLLKNATKFTPVGNTITIRTSNSRPGIVRAEVADTGVGIKPQVIPRLFVAFEQGESRITQPFGGLGLGLVICKAVVDMHGGKIWVESEGEGNGATFFVELPTTDVQVTAQTEATPARSVAKWSPKIGDRNLHILLIEDNEDTLRILSRLLERAGCKVTAAQSVNAALAAAQSAREGAEKFDLVISDLGLPDGDGRKLMRELHDRDGLSGIAISGYGMEEDIEKSHAAGFAEHLTKPIRIEELQAAISRLVNDLPGTASNG